MNAQCSSTFAVFWHTSSNSSHSVSWSFCLSFKFCTFSPNVWHSHTCYMIAHASMLGIQSLSSCAVYRIVFGLFLCLTQFTDEVSFSDFSLHDLGLFICKFCCLGSAAFFRSMCEMHFSIIWSLNISSVPPPKLQYFLLHEGVCNHIWYDYIIWYNFIWYKISFFLDSWNLDLNLIWCAYTTNFNGIHLHRRQIGLTSKPMYCLIITDYREHVCYTTLKVNILHLTTSTTNRKHRQYSKY